MSTSGSFPPVKPPPCPECQQGKHGGCDGATWNNTLDDYDDCPCFLRGHIMTPTAPIAP